MGKILGINALVYIGGVEVPQRNSWSITVNRELQEARVFQATGASSSWVEQTGGFRSWSGSLEGYYDDGDETLTDAIIAGDGKRALLLYENRSTLSNYWYGVAWFELSQNTGVDGFVELSADFTGDGALTRKP